MHGIIYCRVKLKKLSKFKQLFNKFFFQITLTPALLILFLLALLPFLYVIWLSLGDLSFTIAEKKGNFVGFLNYKKALFNDPLFSKSILTTLKYVFCCVILELIIGFSLAYQLSKSVLIRNTFLTFLIIPIFIPPVVVGLIWKVLLQGEFGIISYYLKQLNIIVNESLLSSTKFVFPTMVAIDIWQWTPFVVLIFLSGFISLPKNPFELAIIDGAKPWQIFKNITIPLIIPVAFVIFVIRIIDCFKEFDKIYILTGGGA